MGKLISVTLFFLFCTLCISNTSMAQSAILLDSTGMEHFHRAYYELVPQHETEQAAVEFQLAEEAFSRAIKENPLWVEPYLHLGRCLFVQKKYTEAANIFQKAAKLAPGRDEIQLQIASSLEMAGDCQGALKVLKGMRNRVKNAKAMTVLDELILKMERRAGGK